MTGSGGNKSAPAPTVKWTYVENGSFKEDYFPSVAGPKGSAGKMPKQMKVLKDYEYRGKEGDLLTAFLLLYPGDMDVHVDKVTAEMTKTNSRVTALTSGEWVVFLALLTPVKKRRPAQDARTR